MKDRLEHYFDRLWPINRSLTGDGNRETLAILSEIVPFEIKEIPSGTTCFDWQVPPEWNVREAWIKNSKGEKMVDFSINNLHLLGYSEPFQGKLTFQDLDGHLYTLPEQPELIPYLTSYYKRRWGFCLSHQQYLSLDKAETYEVFIDATLDESGSMTVAEAVIKGASDREILFSTYFCHPSLASNELSGPLVTAFVYEALSKRTDLRYTYRFAFQRETIGAIYYLSEKGTHLKEKLDAGFIVTCIGDDGAFTYKKSRIGNALVDKVCQAVLEQTEEDYNLVEFSPRGSDERQYCSPGFNLPMGSLMRTMYGKYPEYHTSADNKDFVSFAAMEVAVNKFLTIIDVLEKNRCYTNLYPFCEPQLGKRGLYPTLGSQKQTAAFVEAMMWVLNLSDGEHDLIDISLESNIPLSFLMQVVDVLLEKGVLV